QASDAEADAHPSVDNVEQAPAEVSPEVQVHRQVVDPENSHESQPQRQRDSASDRPVSGERLSLVPQAEPIKSGPAMEKVPQVSRTQDFSLPNASRRLLVEEKSNNESLVPVVTDRPAEPVKPSRARRPEPKPAEGVATA